MNALAGDCLYRANAGGAHRVESWNVSGPTIGNQAAGMRAFDRGDDGLIIVT